MIPPIKLFALPYDPGELLQLALEDLESCERDPAVALNMTSWVAKHQRFPGRQAEVEGSGVKPEAVCSVCLAGAAVRGHLPWVFEKLPEESDYAPWRLRQQGFITGTQAASLAAINLFRIGRLAWGLRELQDPLPLVPDYKKAWLKAPVPESIDRLAKAWAAACDGQAGLRPDHGPHNMSRDDEEAGYGFQLDLLDYEEASAQGEMAKRQLRVLIAEWRKLPLELVAPYLSETRAAWMRAEYPWMAEGLIG